MRFASRIDTNLLTSNTYLVVKLFVQISVDLWLLEKTSNKYLF